MMTASQYGNAGAYFTNGGSSNTATRYILGLTTNAQGGRNRVSPYSVIRMDGGGISLTTRIGSPSAAIIGWLGLRPVAFPLVPGWNLDTPIT